MRRHAGKRGSMQTHVGARGRVWTHVGAQSPMQAHAHTDGGGHTHACSCRCTRVRADACGRMRTCADAKSLAGIPVQADVRAEMHVGFCGCRGDSGSTQMRERARGHIRTCADAGGQMRMREDACEGFFFSALPLMPLHSDVLQASRHRGDPHIMSKIHIVNVCLRCIAATIRQNSLG